MLARAEAIRFSTTDDGDVVAVQRASSVDA